MASCSWEKYLFENHKAVAVSPLKGTGRLQLLDVLVKRPGQWLTGSTVEVIDIGSWCDFGLRDGGDEDVSLKKLEKDLKAYVRKLSKGPDDGDQKKSGTEEDEMEEPLVRREIRSTIKENVKVDSGVMSSLMNVANLKSTASEVIVCELEGVTLHYVDRERLNEARKVWKPDFKQIKLHGNPQSNVRGRLDLWLITDILFADKISIGTLKARSTAAGLDLGVFSPILGVPPLSGEIGHGSSSSLHTVRTGGDIPFAIRTMLLRYYSNGELFDVGQDGGEKKIHLRIAKPQNSFDPVRDPVHNMGELYENLPGSGEDDLYTPLAIVFEGDAAAESSSQAAA